MVAGALLIIGCGGGNTHPPLGDDTSGGDGGGGSPDARPIDGPPGAPDASTDGADAVPPVITLKSPAAGALVSGTIVLQVDVVDAEGVSSVTATIAGTHDIPMTGAANDRWTGVFDTTVLAGQVFPTVVVRARDNTGLESQLGFELALDNQAPIAELDPPDLRAASVTNDTLICSRPFDPVGEDAASDGEGVAQLIEFRARVVDLGNDGSSTSAVFVPNAGVGAVRLFVLDDTARPLIVDSDGDGVCDEINPQIVPTTVPSASNEAAVVDLDAVPGSGTADLRDTTFGGANANVCNVGSATTAPAQLCFATAATIAVQTPFLHAPEIYVPPPVGALACEGYAFDAVATNISDGWACAALVATDALGNARISSVMRVCIDSDGNGAEGCPAYNTTAPADQRPDCTGTFNVQTGQVSSTPCSPPRKFPTVAGDYELIRTDL